MLTEKRQASRILDRFVTTIVVLISATLIASGISISRINTEYMTTGVKAAKIVAERASKEISISMDDNLIITRENEFPAADKILSLLPPPVNTGYMIYKEIKETVFDFVTE